MHIYSPQTPKDANDLSRFFQENIDELSEKYNYSDERIKEMKSWHTTNELVEKLLDTNRFFNFSRDKNGKIIFVIESKTSETEPNTEVLQFIFIDKKYRHQNLSSQIMLEFFEYCQNKGIQKIRSFSHIENIISQNFHKKFGFRIAKVDKEKKEIIFEKNFMKTP